MTIDYAELKWVAEEAMPCQRVLVDSQIVLALLAEREADKAELAAAAVVRQSLANTLTFAERRIAELETEVETMLKSLDDNCFWRRPPQRLPDGSWSEPWPEGVYIAWLNGDDNPYTHFGPAHDALWIADIPELPKDGV